MEAALRPNAPSSAVSGPGDIRKDVGNDDSPYQIRGKFDLSSQVLPDHPVYGVECCTCFIRPYWMGNRWIDTEV